MEVAAPEPSASPSPAAGSDEVPNVHVTEGVRGTSAETLDRIFPLFWQYRTGGVFQTSAKERSPGFEYPEDGMAFNNVLKLLREHGMLVSDSRGKQHWDINLVPAEWRMAAGKK